jgi:hypothetical protein
MHELDDGTWLVALMHDDLGHTDPEQRPADHRQSVRHEIVTHVLATFFHPCLRVGQHFILERAKGFEPSTPTLARWSVTTAKYLLLR